MPIRRHSISSRALSWMTTLGKGLSLKMVIIHDNQPTVTGNGTNPDVLSSLYSPQSAVFSDARSNPQTLRGVWDPLWPRRAVHRLLSRRDGRRSIRSVGIRTVGVRRVVPLRGLFFHLDVKTPLTHSSLVISSDVLKKDTSKMEQQNNPYKQKPLCSGLIYKKEIDGYGFCTSKTTII